MIILNATRTPKTIMTDKSELITIMPGSQSKLMIASKNLITAAIKLGTPAEIGIILGGGYEFDVAKSVTASIPYLYTSIEEAISKLIDPTVNYQASLEVQKSTAQLQEELKSKENLIGQLQSKVTELESKLNSSVDAAKCNELEITIADLEQSNRELTRDKSRLDDQVKELQSKLNTQDATVNNLREELGNKVQELSTNTKLISDLNDKVDKLTHENEVLSSNSTSVDFTETEDYKKLASELENAKTNAESMKSEVMDLKQNLEEAVNKIESMKSTFNAACEKFHLYMDDNGEWQQEVTVVD